MTVAKKLKFRPGDKIILFQPRKEPCVAWICTETIGKSIFSNEGKPICKVTRHKKERDEGKGSFMSATHMQPYSDELWEGCERLKATMESLQGEMKLLKRGKIPAI